MRYEWDDAKNRRNRRKHDGISFELAVLLVVHAYREDDHGEEIIRIISARAAEKHEIRRCQEQEMD
jgi:uncharacterized DUF497 family protein